MKRYRKAIEEMDPSMHEALNERVVEDELYKRRSTMEAHAAALHSRWTTQRKLDSLSGKPLRTAKPTFVGLGGASRGQETRVCHHCQKPGHLRVNCPARRSAGSLPQTAAQKQGPATDRGFARVAPSGRWEISETGERVLESLPRLQDNFPKRLLLKPYITPGALYFACGRMNHTREHCFRLHRYPKEFHPYLVEGSGGSTVGQAVRGAHAVPTWTPTQSRPRGNRSTGGDETDR